MLTEKQQKVAASEFSTRWNGRGYEKGECQSFWIDLLSNVFGVEKPTEFIRFEQQVMLDHTSFIDAMIPATHVMIEQKSIGKDLRQPIKQSDGTLLKPIEQAQRYSVHIPYSERPRWIVISNFAEFDVYDLEHPHDEPQHILLADLEHDFHRLRFLVDQGNDHIRREEQVSLEAGAIVARIYDAFLPAYGDKPSDEDLRQLNILCVRLVFCLYAEDAGIFPKHDQFHDFLAQFPTSDLRMWLVQLFQTLNTPTEQRDRFLRPDLMAFPYTNGGLFAETIDVPPFTDELREVLIKHASQDFDWSAISPTIFGAVFESTLNPETRRSGGMHYTSIENIHRVIDPLFLDNLHREYDEIMETKDLRRRTVKLKEMQQRMASLTFFDPACGSGNFLTETYLSLRRLENKMLCAINQVEPFDIFVNPIKVSIHQFYGIEINDFAVTVATTALWISEAQTMQETEKIIHHDIDFLPLKSYANIHEGNSLTIPWEKIVEPTKLSYIIGNPPFVGYSLQTKEQKADMLRIFVDEKGKPYKTAGKLDYVAAWYYKAAQMMQGTEIRTALVSTNSITQGEQVSAIWKPLKELFSTHIDFAYRTFQWDSESTLKAHVHVVIIGFSNAKSKGIKYIYDNEKSYEAKNINAYLINAPDIFVESRGDTLCNVPDMITGNRPADGGFLIIEGKDYDEFVKKEPKSVRYIKKLIGSREFINKIPRYCLWLVGVSPREIKEMPIVLKRVELCKEDRLNAPDDGRKKLADTPTLFRETNNPPTAIVVPKVSSEKRKYIPMGYIKEDVIASDLLFLIPSATLFHFGILESNVHMAWMRAVCGRLKSDYRYSKDVVYNNFPWPSPTAEQEEKIRKTAQGILDARALYPDSSLADLYDPVLMPAELLKAHRQNDVAVMTAYGFSTKMTEPECVARLLEMYEKMKG